MPFLVLHKLIFKATKFQLPLPKRLSTVVKNIGRGGGHDAPMSNRVNDHICSQSINI